MNDAGVGVIVTPPGQAADAHGNSRRWWVLLLLTVGVLISFVDRTNISAAIADKKFIGDFGLSQVDRGTLGSAFFWSYGIAQLFMGWFVDRYGVKWLYAVFFSVWCMATAATGLVSSFAALLAMRFLIGAAEAVAIPASYRWIRDNFDDTRTGLAIGIFTSGNKFGNAIGAPIAAWLIVHYGWQSMFVVTGLIGLVWLIPWLLFVPSGTEERTTAGQSESAMASVTWRAIFASPVVWGSLVINFCYGYFGFFCATWMPSYLHEARGLSLERSGVYTGLSFAGVALVAIFGGWAADKLIARGHDPIVVRKAFIVGGFLGACTVLLGANATSLAAAVFWGVASLSILGFATANLQALCRLALIPKPAVGRVTGVQQVATSLSGGVAASLSGWLLHISGGYTLPMFIIFVFLLVGAATTWFMMHPKWSPKVSKV
jgi:MFS transporter, ACS family, D-galactonate transporter